MNNMELRMKGFIPSNLAKTKDGRKVELISYSFDDKILARLNPGDPCSMVQFNISDLTPIQKHLIKEN